MGRPEGSCGVETAYIKAHTHVVIEARKNGESCRSIADRYGVPEWTIHNLMKRTGNAGRFRAKSNRPRRGPRAGRKTEADILSHIEEAADDLVIERLADDSGWIATIDDLTGEPHERISGALRSAYEKWRA